MNKIHEVGKIKFEENLFYIAIDGKDFVFDLKLVSERLLNASLIERDTFEVLASGYGIHWPIIDEDLSINGLLNLYNISQQKINLKKELSKKNNL